MSQAMEIAPFEVLFWAGCDHAKCLGKHPLAARFGPNEWLELRSWMHKAVHTTASTTLADYCMTGKLTYGGLPVLRMRAAGVAIVTGPWKAKY